LNFHKPPLRWRSHIFDENGIQSSTINEYGYFVASLLNLVIHQNTQGDLFCNASVENERQAYYSVITLNYDLVLENCFFHLKNFGAEDGLGFQKQNYDSISKVYLAKLHGSVDTENIVPPTWNKGLNEGIKPAWNLAYKLLTEANQIRIVGYSLPIADAYIKYLLKAAIIECDHLKNIDILCRDWDGSVKKRYEEFIQFPKWKFISEDIALYINKNYTNWVNRDSHIDTINLNGVEDAHNHFFNERRFM